MHGIVIVNGRAAAADSATGVRAAATAKGLEVVVPDAGTTRQVVAQAVARGVELVIAVGGDGTIHEVVNAIGPARLGIVPAGTGNDLARTLGLPKDPMQAFELAVSGPSHWLDLMAMTFDGTRELSINAAAGGFSGQVDEALSDELKKTWGPLAYLLGAAKVLPDLTAYETTIQWDGGASERISALNVIVANGRTIGGGKRVAPRANPADGLLDVVVIRRGAAAELAALAARLLAGDVNDSELSTHRRAQRVAIASRPGMWWNADGELLTKSPVVFEVVPAALRVVVPASFAAAS